MRLIADLRYAVRLSTRTPAFTIPAVASLALGIAVNTTMFGIVNAVLLKPLATGGYGELVRIGRSTRTDRQFRSVSYDELLHLREHAASLAGLAGHQLESVTMTAADGAFVVSTETVTADYFSVVGATPSLGRGFGPAEDRLGGDSPVAVISDRFWRRHFRGDPAVVGREVSLNRRPFTIVGVAPPGFSGTFPGVDIDIWVPATMVDVLMHKAERRSALTLMLVGRLKPGTSIRTAEAELEGLARRMADEDPQRDRARSFAVAAARGIHPALARVVGAFLLLLMGVVGVVLLIACANVASLFLARASARTGEFAVRLACGASRGRVLAQLLVESSVIAVLGGGIGVLLSVGALALLNRIILTTGPTGAPIYFNLQLDARVLLFTAALTMMTTLVFGLAPGVRAARVDLIAALKDSRSLAGRRRSRLRGALVIVQVALSFALLVAAVLLFQSLRNSHALDLGFNPDGVVVATFDQLRTLGYDRPRMQAFYADVLARARTTPGVEQAALADFIPTVVRGGTIEMIAPGAAGSGERDPVTVPCGRVSDQYFATVRQPLVRGRDFTPQDRPGAPLVIIVNEAMARRFWPGRDPLGARVRIGENGDEFAIVGIVRDAKYQSLTEDGGPFIFFPMLQREGSSSTLYVRASSALSAVAADIGRVVRDVDPNVPYRGQPMRERLAFSLVPVRVAQSVFGVAGVIALLLASGGLYGLVSYTLEQRLKEIGIRVALGATRQRVFRMIVGGAVRLTAVGVAIGAAIAAGAARLVSSLLYGLSPTDPPTFVGIAVLLTLVTLGAGYAAARKGLDVDPMTVLRNE
jgi:predicted permease